jgi:uncharacterized protein
MTLQEALVARARPKSPHLHLLRAETGAQVFLPAGSLLFDVDEALAEELSSLLEGRGEAAVARREALGLEPQRRVCETTLEAPRTRAISLAVAQSCNLACGYCYAQGGEFGGASKQMDLATAQAAIDLLVRETEPGERANLAFLGGEPLMARPTLQAATRYAAAAAQAKGVRLGYSVTTNGTLVSPADADFFEEFGFAVTISVDGLGAAHDRLRPFRGGRGSYDRLLRRIEPLLTRQRRAQVSARITVTPENLDLLETLEAFVALGFHTVGFSPMLSAPTGRHEMQPEHLGAMLEAMVACGEAFERRTLAGERYPFANLLNAFREIHKGTHRPYPCGAGAGYLGVSADGKLSACHRFVGDPLGDLGDVTEGVDRKGQAAWLEARHVSAQVGCGTCWARYLCAGGCHHETLHRGRPACDFIRGWLHYAIGAYGRMARTAPEALARIVG